MEQQFISFEETNAQVGTVTRSAVAQAIDLCGAYAKAKPILLFAKQFLPKTWKEIVEALMKFLDEHCNVQS
jgi:hypothetical protein